MSLQPCDVNCVNLVTTCDVAILIYLAFSETWISPTYPITKLKNVHTQEKKDRPIDNQGEVLLYVSSILVHKIIILVILYVTLHISVMFMQKDEHNLQLILSTHAKIMEQIVLTLEERPIT